MVVLLRIVYSAFQGSWVVLRIGAHSWVMPSSAMSDNAETRLNQEARLDVQDQRGFVTEVYSDGVMAGAGGRISSQSCSGKMDPQQETELILDGKKITTLSNHPCQVNRFILWSVL